MQRTGAQILLECLEREGTSIIFGYPGGAVLDIYNVLGQSKITHILARHEQAAVHAADGYARATGKVGVALVTSGPGATNAVTSIATAHMDSIPLIVISGQVPTALIGNDAFQEVDIVGITRPCTKHNYLVRDIQDLPRILREAFYIARSGRPGPVLIDIPKDVQKKSIDFEWSGSEVKIRSYHPKYEPHLGQVRKAAAYICQAKKPIIYSGGGIISSGAFAELSTLAKNFSIPVTSTLMGLGAFPGTDKLWLGMLGMHGTYTANMAMNNADLVIAVGARFDDRVTGNIDTFAKLAKIVHIDIDPTSIQKNVLVNVPIVADCKSALTLLLQEMEEVRASHNFEEAHQEWLTQIDHWKNNYPLKYKESEAEKIRPQAVLEALQKITKGEAIITTDVGQHQMWAAQFLTFNKPRNFLTSGGLGTMGYGFPAAIGAQFAFPESMVVCITGDGSIQMNIQELAVAVTHRLNVKILLLNNHSLGMVRQWQEIFYNKNYSHSLAEVQPDFVKLAEAYGARGFRITKASTMEKELQEAMATKGTVFIDVHVEAGENVFPMVPAGASISDMLLV